MTILNRTQSDVSVFKSDQVGIIGVGPGGLNIAAVAKKRAFDVLLYSDPDHSKIFNVLKENDGVLVAKGDETVAGEFSTNIARDLIDIFLQTNIVFVTIPVQGRHRLFAERIIPLLQEVADDGQPLLPDGFSKHLFIFIPDSFSIVATKELFTDANVPKKLQPLYIMGTSSAPASSRFIQAESFVKGTKESLIIGCLPPNPPKSLKRLVGAIMAPSLHWTDAIQVVMMQVNMIIHPAGLLAWLNKAREEVEAKGQDPTTADLKQWMSDYFFYRDALATNEAQRLVNGADGEKEILATVLKREPWSVLDTVNFHYGTDFETWEDFLEHSPVLNLIKDGPKTGKHRHFDQDVPYGAAVLEELCDFFECPADYCSEMVEEANNINKTDYRATRPNLEQLGLGGLSKKQAIEKWTSYPYYCWWQEDGRNSPKRPSSRAHSVDISV